MAHVTISIRPEGADRFSDALQQIEWARSMPGSTVASKDVLEVSVKSIEECERVGAAIAAWVAGTTADFSLQIAGPGADSELKMLRTEYDAHLISGLIEPFPTWTGGAGVASSGARSTFAAWCPCGGHGRFACQV